MIRENTFLIKEVKDILDDESLSGLEILNKMAEFILSLESEILLCPIKGDKYYDDGVQKKLLSIQIGYAIRMYLNFRIHMEIASRR